MLLNDKLADLATRRELFVNLTLRELRSKYKRSVLGWAWSLLNPLTTLVIYGVVFGVFLRVPPDVGDPSGLENFAMFLMCGLLPFTFLSNGLNSGMTSLIGNGNLVKKVYFPREILVASTTAAWVVSFLIELAVLGVALAFFGNIIVLWIPMVLVLVALQVVFVYGLALVLAGAAVYFRDLEHLLGLVLQVWMYSAPIVYPLYYVEDKVGAGSTWMTLYNLNPLTRFVEAYRDVLYHLRFPPLADMAYLVVVAAAALLIGQIVFGRLEGRLAEEL